MLIDPPLLFPRRPRRKPRLPAGAPTPPGLALGGANYDSEEQTLTLEFDRAVDISAYDGAAITVNDGDDATQRFNGLGGASLIDELTVRISLGVIGESTGPGLTMNASAASGIVAVDDAGTWAGVTDVGLPFP